MDIGAVGNSRDASAQQPSTYDQPSWAGQAYGWDASGAYGGVDGGGYSAFGGGPAAQWQGEWDPHWDSKMVVS